MGKTMQTQPMFNNEGKVIGWSGVGGRPLIEAPRITKENAALVTDEQWDAAYDAAVSAGDMVETQRLRDLHFMAKAPSTKVGVKVSHGSNQKDDFYEFKTYPKYKGSLKPLDEYSRGNDITAGAFFGDNSNGSISEFGTGLRGRMRDFYLNIENPIVIDAENRAYDNLPNPYVSKEWIE